MPVQQLGDAMIRLGPCRRPIPQRYSKVSIVDHNTTFSHAAPSSLALTDLPGEGSQSIEAGDRVRASGYPRPRDREAGGEGRPVRPCPSDHPGVAREHHGRGEHKQSTGWGTFKVFHASVDVDAGRELPSTSLAVLRGACPFQLFIWAPCPPSSLEGTVREP